MAKIEYRKVTPEERLAVSRVQGTAFSFEVNEKEMREKIEKGEYKNDEVYAALDGDGRALAAMEALPYTMWYDGQKVPMYGIGGVASMPETRRQGHVRKIFEKIFEDIYEKGVVFSHLFPFSHDYYRKFGYEHCGAATKYTLPVEPARRFLTEGETREFVKGGPEQNSLIAVYESYAARHNVMLSRSPQRWDEVLNISPYGVDKLYYWSDAGGDIRSWAKFRRNGRVVEISEIAWEDRAGMLGILRFMGMFEGAAEKFSFRASPEFIAELYWNNLYDIQIENQWIGMNRVLNAKRALELLKKPEKEGSFTIKINDGFAKWNNNTYRVEYGGGDCRVETSDLEADVETSEIAFVHMALGLYEFEQVQKRYDVQPNKNFETLKKAFCKKPILITDHF
ncbi:MAG: GNAT family N-acetyltransferase [Oscillospiraceae bacterium]|nr:GNAT family N-acetyltransferase [Oscillospiraceae bacterium]